MIKNRKYRIIIVSSFFLAIFLLSFISQPLLANAKINSDDDDIEVQLDAQLESNALEFHGSELIGTGNYDFFDEPELDTGSFLHDRAYIEVSELQYPLSTSTGKVYGELNETVFADGYTTFNSSTLPEYEISAPRESVMSVVIDYNMTKAFGIWTGVRSGMLGTNYDGQGISDMCWDGTHWNVVQSWHPDIARSVYVYDVNWNFIASYTLLGAGGSIGSIGSNRTHNIIMDHGENMRLYDTDWNFIRTKPSAGGYGGVASNGTHWFVMNQYGSVYMYDEQLDYTGKFWDKIDEDVGDNPNSLTYKDDKFYVAGWDRVGSEHRNVAVFDMDFNLEHVYPTDDDGWFWYSKPTGIDYCDVDDSWWILDTWSSERRAYQYSRFPDYTLMDYVNITDFAYTKLGMTYYENYTVDLDTTLSRLDTDMDGNGSMVFTFDSSYFEQYGGVNDITVDEQILNLSTDFGGFLINYSSYINYSSNSWRVPSEVDLRINGESVVDETFNSGSVILLSYPDRFIISTTDPVYFKMNVSIYFSFTIDLTVISKTWLTKTFELLSDHLISIDQLTFDSDLNIKKIYLNNEDLGNSNPCYLIPYEQMDTNDVFTLEIILNEEIYQQLPYDDFRLIFSELFGSVSPYMSHDFYPDDHSALYSVANQVYMYNQYANSFINEDFSSWNLGSDSEYTDSSYSDGDISSYLANDSSSAYPYFYNIDSGYQNTDGELLSVDSDYATYLSQSEGIYNGEYNFADELIETEGTDIRFVDSATLPNDCNVEISSEIDGHKKVLNITHDGGANDPIVIHYFPDGDEVSGTREFWWGSSDVSETQEIRFKDGSAIQFRLRVITTHLWYYDGNLDDWVDSGGSLSNDVLAHFKVGWDCGTDDYSVWLNGVLEVDDIEFENVGNYVDQTYFISVSNNAYSQYLDAFDRPEADGYTSGRNKEPIMYLGNYPATYSFDDDEVWTKGLDITLITQFPTVPDNVEVIYELDGHRKILKLERSGTSNEIINNFPDTKSGIVEFWYYSGDATDRIWLYFTDEGINTIKIKSETDNLMYDNGTGFKDIADIVDNIWYHIRLSFREDETCDVFLDGIKIVDNEPIGSYTDGIDRLLFNMQQADDIKYFDAIGYSWDPNYAIGDNYYFQYFQGSYPFEQYNLSTNQNYYGTHDFSNISTPEGWYKGSAGFNYETPEHDKYYTGSPYNFNDENIGTKGTNIKFINTTSNENNFEIINEFNNHNKPLSFFDDAGYTYGAHYLVNRDQLSGITEYWLSFSDTNTHFRIYYKGDGQDYLYYRFRYDEIQYSNGTKIADIYDNTWFHLKTQWFSDSTYDMYLNGVKMINRQPLLNTLGSGIFEITIIGYGNDNSKKMYLDGYGNSIVDDYSAGDNYFPGNSGEDLDWIDLDESNLKSLTYITTELDNHKNVLTLEDNNTWGRCQIIHNYPTVGADRIIEIWIAISDNTKTSAFVLIPTEGGATRMQVELNQDDLQYYDGAWQDIKLGFIVIDTFIHIKLVLDDSANTYDIYVNGILEVNDGAYQFNTTTGIDGLRIQTQTGQIGYKVYVDAPGLVLEPDPQGYTYEESWNINPYDIEPLLDEGFILDVGLDTYINISSVDGHNNVLEIGDDNTGDVVYVNIPFSTQTTGTIEWWWRTSSTDYPPYVFIRGGGSIAISLHFVVSNNTWYYYANGINNYFGETLKVDQWYHHKIVFDTDTDTFDWYINGTLMVNDGDFRNVRTYLNNFQIGWGTGQGAITYLDAFSYTWDPNYDVGTNTNPYYEELRDTGFLDDWDITYAPYTWVNISGEYGQHKKVLEIYDNNNAYVSYVVMPFSSTITYGSIEFYMKTSDATYETVVYIGQDYGAGLSALYFKIDDDKFRYYDGSWNDVGLGANDNQFYYIRIDFECTTGEYEDLAQYDWNVHINGVEYGDYNFGVNRANIGHIRFDTQSVDAGYSYYIDSISYSWEDPIGINLKTNNRMELNFTAPIRLTGFYDNDTVEALIMNYAYMTNIYQNISFYAYNFVSDSFTLINSSANNQSFYSSNYDLNWNNYVNATNDILLKFYGYNNTNNFELYIDMLNTFYNWTKTSGDIYAQISKNVATAFLNRYDAFSDYLKLYNITLGFTYTFTTYQGAYSDYADITYNGTNTALTTDGSPYDFSITFEYDSTSSDEFNIQFNISNGLLELSVMSYEYVFKSLDTDNNVKMYQEFILDCNLDLEDYQERYYDFILNFTIVSFNPADDYSKLTEDTNYSSLKYIVNMSTEIGNVYYNYSSNSSISSQTVSINLRNLIPNNYLNNLNLHFLVAGNNSYIYLDSVYLYPEDQYSMQKTINPRTDIDSVEFCYYYKADTTYDYWYVGDSYSVNSIDMVHENSGTTVSSIESENYKYYFNYDTNLDDEFNSTVDYNPNWDVSSSYIDNDASYSYIKVDYSADLVIYNVSMILDLRNMVIFDDVDNQGRDDYVLTIDDLIFTASTKTLYITGTRTQHTVNPQTDHDSIQMNETITYNGEILTTSLVSTNPDWYISTSMVEQNATYGKMEILYSADATYTNVDLKTTITRNEMYDDTVEVEGYQNTTTLAFELSAITFNSSNQIIYIEGFRYLDETIIYTNITYVDYEERYYWSLISLSNHSIEIKPDWIILSSIDEYNGTYAKIKVEYESDIAINNVILQFSRTRTSIFGDLIEIVGYQNTTIIEFSLSNINFTTSYQTTYIDCFRTISELNPTTNMTYLDFNEEYKWSSISLSNYSIEVNPYFVVDYGIMSNNGTFTELNITYNAGFSISNILLKLNLKYDDLYAENWSNNATQSLYTYILEIPDINFTTSYQILNLTGLSSIPYINFSSFINEAGFKISDEEWKIRISNSEWRTIKRANWEDIDIYMYGYLDLTKYSRSFIVSDIEDDWELDGVHYQDNNYDISTTGYFVCEGFGSGITTAYLRFKTNPIKDLKREQKHEQVIYKIKSEFNLEDVDFIFYIEESERYNSIDMIKQLKKEIDCTDIVRYYSVEDRDYYMIMNMDLDEGTNKIIINYEIENAVEYAWVGIIVGIAMIGFALIYISYRYKDDKIMDFLGLDKIVKLFIWIKKPERIKLTKKYRLNKKRKKR